ncbi:MAG: phosphoribosylanthranilate isomerase [Roseiflexaceae bacterium]
MVAVKICGLRTVEHALTAASLGADMLGFILAPSRRQVRITEVARIRAALALQPKKPELVGVFVNAHAAEIRSAVAEAGLDLVQLSGDEPLSLLDELPGLRVIKAIRLSGDPIEQAWLRSGAHHDHVRLLIDGHAPGSYGGAGVIADWKQAAELARQYPILLAGGLNPANVTRAIEEVHPWGVDVSSGVENEGVKDPHKIGAFLAAARSVTA